MNDIRHRYFSHDGLRLHYAEAGAGPLVVLVHGFPETWYSYRHQLRALAAAGYRAVAMDLRGFGDSDVPRDVGAYSLLRHADDVCALVRELQESRAVLVGHDWGANLVWLLALRDAALVRAVFTLSIPFYPQPRDPREIKRFAPGRFNFVSYFQRPGAVEAEFERDPRAFLRAFFYGLSGGAPAGTIDHLYREKPESARLLDGFPQPPEALAWLGERDLDHYVAAFERTGMSGALGFYRNMEQDFPALQRIYRGRIDQPAAFMGGAEEAAVRYGTLEPMRAALTNLRDVTILDGCGHWVQQERPDSVNRALLDFLQREGLREQNVPSASAQESQESTP